MRRARQNYKEKNGSKKKFEYAKNKQALQTEDLQRYGIQVHFIDKFEEVTDILKSIERQYFLSSIFVSGSAHDIGSYSMDRLLDLCMLLGERIIEKDLRLISGMGLNVGDSVVKGALLKLYEKGNVGIEKKLTIRPFPRNLPQGMNEDEFNLKYRMDMISKCGIAIFIAGTSRSHNESAGVLQEFEITNKLNKIPIPIGATGFAARKIWESMECDLDTYYAGKVSPKTFAKLNDPNINNNQLLDAVFEIIECVTST
jgi:hypothetical protein